MVTQAAVSALINVIIFAGIPFLPYFIYHKLRHKRPAAQIAKRAGLQLGEPRYIGYCLIFAAANVALFVIWKPPIEPLTREGSAWRQFLGLGLSGTSITLALLYGVVKTGFSEELLFRGLIAGCLSRRLPLRWANILQAVIFLAPHLLFLKFMSEMWFMLIFVFIFALIAGWARIKSGSIVGPWLIHAAGNTAVALNVAIRSAH